MNNIDCIVAGAGLWGLTIARTLAEHGRKVLVLERRPHIGGNARCHVDKQTGIEVHDYGCHIFHTDDQEVWNFMCRFTEFNRYQHKCIAIHDNKPYFLPIGLALVNAFYGINLKPNELEDFIKSQALQYSSDIDPELNFETKAISLVGRPLYEAFIKNYTEKQWGTSPVNIPASMMSRLPVRCSYDLNYYNNHVLQGIPLAGYETLFKNMTQHPNIIVETGVDYLQWRKLQLQHVTKKPTFYSGPIDELFEFKHGPLPWRSLRFEFDNVNVKDYQGTSIVNYPDSNVPYTRILEFKHFHPESNAMMQSSSTIICREYPMSWSIGNEPYYPVECTESAEKLKLYREDAQKMPNLVIGGRLGGYQYNDMDKTVRNALNDANYMLYNS